ncbi:MAG: DEAD/DEAH box helicase family protein [Saprospiraceae bacterium]|nr:DEAD/DEAH box helicase family protein [Saprospiraceae bacterium]
MATGSGKTLVMVKLIEILFQLSQLKPEEGGIPKTIF